MNDPRIIAGVIISHAGTSPGPASGITYTIATADPNAAGVFNMRNQTPVSRWPDTLDTVAMPDGTGVIGVSVGAVVSWHFVELPDFAECPSNSGGSSMLDLLRSGGIPQAFIPGGPSFGAGDASNANGTPSGGGTSQD